MHKRVLFYVYFLIWRCICGMSEGSSGFAYIYSSGGIGSLDVWYGFYIVHIYNFSGVISRKSFES